MSGLSGAARVDIVLRLYSPRERRRAVLIELRFREPVKETRDGDESWRSSGQNSGASDVRALAATQHQGNNLDLAAAPAKNSFHDALRSKATKLELFGK